VEHLFADAPARAGLAFLEHNERRRSVATSYASC
jgi:hypothetical protein